MKLIWTDFNAQIGPNGEVSMETRGSRGDLKDVVAGERVLLYQDEDDFEVEGVLLQINGRMYAQVDWDTIKYLGP